MLAALVREEHRRLATELGHSAHVLMVQHRFGRKLSRRVTMARREHAQQLREDTPLVVVRPPNTASTAARSHSGS